MPLTPSPVFQRPDIMIQRPDGRPGTAGCVVRRVSDNQLYLLSNAHVMGWGGNPVKDHGTVLITDGTNGAVRPIAVLGEDDWSPHWPPHQGESTTQRFDAAIAKLLNQDDPAIQRIGVPNTMNTLIKEGMPVHMTGARSGGPIHSVLIDATFDLELKLHLYNGKDIPYAFNPLFLCRKPFSVPGDSGSAVYDANGALIGLILGSCAEGSVFCRADLIFERFGLVPAA
jgi:hypothetical protein